MTFLTYAQNFEDVLLRRALAGVQRGTYIDVGAADPELDSVTKAFSDDGWTGINIEPLASFHARLMRDRPRDVNLRAAAADEAGTMTLFEVEGYPELSTTVPEVAADLAERGRVVVEQLVPAVTLAEVCARHIDGPVHFLKIDVEGAELAVLRGADFTAVRPWILVVETVTFGRSAGDATEREAILGAAGYRPVYFDGLNDFYLAEEHADLASAFELPVNVRDDFRVPVEGRARASLDRVAGLLGLEAFADEHEVLERLESLRADRIAFESAVLEARAAVEAANVDRDDAHRELGAVRRELDGYRQQSFERERYLAWQATEILRANHERSAAAAAAQAQVDALLRSTSWRLSLPVRVLRRPGPYLRKLTGR